MRNGKSEGGKPTEKHEQQATTALSTTSDGLTDQYFNFFQLSTDPMCIADPFGCFKRVNPAFVRLTGYEESELLSKPFLDFVLPEDRQRTENEMKLQVSVRRSMNFENRYVCKDGSTIYLSWTAYYDKNEGITYATARDITERKRTEKVLRESQARLQHVVANAPTVIYVLTPGFAATWVSDNAETILGYSPAECLSPNWWADHVYPDERQRVLAEMARVFELKQFSHEYRFQFKDGSYHWIRDNLRLMRDPQGNPLEIIGAWTDITKRKRAEEALSESEEKFRSIVQNTAGAIFVRDATRKIIYVSPQCERVMGYPPDAYRETIVLNLIHPEDRPCVEAAFEKLYRTGEGFRDLEHRTGLPDGSYRWVATTASSITLADGARGVQSYVRDISEKKRAESGYAQLAAIVDSSQDAILSRGMDLKVLTWNAAAERMFGYAAHEVIGKAVTFLVPEDRWPEVDSNRELLAKSQPVPAYDTVRLAKDGRRIDVSITQSPIKDAGNRMIGASLTIRDITEHSRDKRELLESEARCRGLVEQSIAGIYIIQDGKLVYANPRAAEIVGQGSTDNLIGTDPLVWITDADRGTVAENLRRLVDGEAERLALDFGVLRRDGVVIQVGANAARATHEGRPAIVGLLQDISEKTRAEAKIKRYVAQLETAFMSTVKVATTLAEMRDPYTAGHQRRVAEIAVAIGAELGFDERGQEGLRVAGYLHDIGKITIPAEILSKPGKLSPIEFQLIKGHAQCSYDALKDVEFPWPVAEVAWQHHERMDGSGYPQGLKGEAILLEARIMAVADVIEAMSSHRPYRAGLGIDKTLAEIERGRGSAYDTDVADACLKLFREKGYVIAV